MKPDAEPDSLFRVHACPAKINKYLACVLLLIPILLNAEDNFINNGFRFLAVNPSPRSVAMGGTSSSFNPEGNMIYNNPAIINNFDMTTLSISSIKYFADQAFFNSSLIIKTKTRNFGILFSQYSTPDFMEYYKFNEHGSLFKNRNMTIGLSSGISFSKAVLLGVNIKYMRNSFYIYEKSFLVLDTGLIYEYIKDNASFGISINNLGLDVQYEKLQAINLPAELRLNASKQLERLAIASVELCKELSGIYQISLGLEIFPGNVISPRAGYAISGNLHGLKLGAGLLLDIDSIQIKGDYAYNFSVDLQMNHWLGISLLFP